MLFHVWHSNCSSIILKYFGIELTVGELHGQVEHVDAVALPLQLGGVVHVDDDQGSTLHVQGDPKITNSSI